MCLGVPMKVTRILADMATCELNGVNRSVSLSLVGEDVNVGDYVVVHLGFAIERIKADLARDAKFTWKEWQEHVSRSELPDA